MHVCIPSSERHRLKLVNFLDMFAEVIVGLQMRFIQGKPPKFCIKLNINTRRLITTLPDARKVNNRVIMAAEN